MLETKEKEGLLLLQAGEEGASLQENNTSACKVPLPPLLPKHSELPAWMRVGQSGLRHGPGSRKQRSLGRKQLAELLGGTWED